MGIVSGPEATVVEDARTAIATFEAAGVEVALEQRLAATLGREGAQLEDLDADIIAVVGSDRCLLDTLIRLGDRETPVLPVSSKGQPDFLFDVTVTALDTVVGDLMDGRWTEDRRMRLVATIGGSESPPLLNDVAVFARRSATLMRYTLVLDGEPFWKDGSDGLIVSTPTGSTAYSMSVGGPVVLNSAPVFSIVTVNSVNPARRPLIVSDRMEVEIRDLISSVKIEAVLDGQLRKEVGDGPVTIRRSDSDAVFVKFSEERIAVLRGKLLKKAEVFDNAAHDLPPSAKLVLKVLEYKGQLTQRQIIEETMLPARTVRHALSLLISEGLVQKRVSLRDSRQGLYRVTPGPPGQRSPPGLGRRD